MSDIVMASSRGFDVEVELPKLHPSPSNLHIYAEAGGKLEDLAALVPDFIEHIGEQDTQGHHVYFLAGLCDVTFKDSNLNYKNDHERYEEVFFMESWQEGVDRVTKSIHSVAESMNELNVIPIFSTIPPCSLHTWNFNRLNKGKTSYLLHHNYYEDMQYSLISTIQQLNNTIVQYNTSNGVTTPHIATSVMSNTGPNTRPRVFYTRFRDGVHADKDLKKKWAKKLNKAMIENRRIQTARRILPAQIEYRYIDSDHEDEEYVDRILQEHMANTMEEARQANWYV